MSSEVSQRLPRLSADRRVSCKRCLHDHEATSVIEWLWALRNTKPKPKGGSLGVLAMLAARMSPRTGCGRLTIDQLAEDSGVSADTAGRAIAWAQSHLLVAQLERGHRITPTVVRSSLWHLTIANPAPMRDWPDTQPRTDA